MTPPSSRPVSRTRSPCPSSPTGVPWRSEVRTTDPMPVAMIGLGAMGAGMAHRLLAQGHAVSVWNRSAEKAGELVDAGARLASTPGKAVHDAAVAFVSVADGDALTAVLEGPEGVLAG